MQFSCLAKSACCIQYLLVFCLISGFTSERLILGLRWKDWALRALLFAVTRLWPHKVGSRVEIYLARWKFMLISDEAKDLVKIVWKVGAVWLLFNGWFTSRILNKSTVSELRKVPCDDLCFRPTLSCGPHGLTD